jgi:hypothetical protein
MPINPNNINMVHGNTWPAWSMRALRIKDDTIFVLMGFASMIP